MEAFTRFGSSFDEVAAGAGAWTPEVVLEDEEDMKKKA
jgi:hypothetical protein